MADGAINIDLTVIPDKAEVWLALKSDVDNIDDMIPDSVEDDLVGLGWEHTGLVNDKKGIPVNPSIEVKKYDAFGHPAYRQKLRNGDLKTGFTALERNSVTNKIVLPGSAPNMIGRPKDVQIYVLYKYVDEDRTTIWVQLRPAPVEVKAMSGIIDGDEWWADMTVHHTANAAGDIFQTVTDAADDVVKTFTIDPAVTAYTATVDSVTSTSIATKTATALQSALRLLSTVTALPSPGVTVEGPTGGPLVATFTGPVTAVSATGTGGTVTVS